MGDAGASGRAGFPQLMNTELEVVHNSSPRTSGSHAFSFARIIQMSMKLYFSQTHSTEPRLVPDVAAPVFLAALC